MRKKYSVGDSVKARPDKLVSPIETVLQVAEWKIKKVWDMQDVASEFGISKRTVSSWMRARRIPFIKANRVVRFIPENVLRAMGAFEVQAISRLTNK